MLFYGKCFQGLGIFSMTDALLTNKLNGLSDLGLMLSHGT